MNRNCEEESFMANTIIRKDGLKLTVIPETRLDTATAPELKTDIVPHLEGIHDVLMDFEHVEYISSAGLRVLLEIYQTMEDRGGTLRITHVSKSIMAIFNLVNFAEIVTIE